MGNLGGVVRDPMTGAVVGVVAPGTGNVFCSGCREWIDAGKPEGLGAEAL